MLFNESLSLREGQTEEAIIQGGSPPYGVEPENSLIAGASISESTVSVIGLTAGSTEIKILDDTGDNIILYVTVIEDHPLTATPESLSFQEEGEIKEAIIEGGTPPYLAESENSSIAEATINEGTISVIARGAGSTAIEISDQNNGLIFLYIEVNYNPPLTINPELLILNKTETEEVVIHGGLPPYDVESNDSLIADVTLNGNVIEVDGVEIGSTSVIISDQNGESTLLHVTVTQDDPLTVDPENLNLLEGETEILTILGGLPPYNAIIGNASIADVSLEGSIVSVSGLSVGSTSLAISDSANEIIFSEITVYPCCNQSEAFPLSVVPEMLFVTDIEDSEEIIIYGGTPPYVLLPTDDLTASVSLLGNTITITGQCSGSVTLNIADRDSNIVEAIVLVNNPNQDPICTENLPSPPYLEASYDDGISTVSWSAEGADGYYLYWALSDLEGNFDLGTLQYLDVGIDESITARIGRGVDLFLAVQAYNSYGFGGLSRIQYLVDGIPHPDLDIVSVMVSVNLPQPQEVTLGISSIDEISYNLLSTEEFHVSAGEQIAIDIPNNFYAPIYVTDEDDNLVGISFGDYSETSNLSIDLKTTAVAISLLANPVGWAFIDHTIDEVTALIENDTEMDTLIETLDTIIKGDIPDLIHESNQIVWELGAQIAKRSIGTLPDNPRAPVVTTSENDNQVSIRNPTYVPYGISSFGIGNSDHSSYMFFNKRPYWINGRGLLSAYGDYEILGNPEETYVLNTGEYITCLSKVSSPQAINDMLSHHPGIGLYFHLQSLFALSEDLYTLLSGYRSINFSDTIDYLEDNDVAPIDVIRVDAELKGYFAYRLYTLIKAINFWPGYGDVGGFALEAISEYANSPSFKDDVIVPIIHQPVSGKWLIEFIVDYYINSGHTSGTIAYSDIEFIGKRFNLSKQNIFKGLRLIKRLILIPDILESLFFVRDSIESPDNVYTHITVDSNGAANPIPYNPFSVIINTPAHNSEFFESDFVQLGGNTDSGSDIVSENSYFWYSNLDGDLGTGSSLTLPPFTLSTGEHKIKLLAIDGKNVGRATAINIVVNTAENLPLPFNAVIDNYSNSIQHINIGQQFLFSSNITGGVPPYSIQWNFPNSGIPDKYDEDPGHLTFNSIGTFEIVYQASDAIGNIIHDSFTLIVEPLELTCTITRPLNRPTNIGQFDRINFQGKADNGVPPYSHLWLFTDNSIPNKPFQNPGYITFSSIGTVVATYRVTDSQGNVASDNIVINVQQNCTDEDRDGYYKEANCGTEKDCRMI